MPEIHHPEVQEPEHIWEPFKVIDNFDYNPDMGRFTPPFATEYEWHDALLTGSESATLCSKGNPIVSRNFVQCSGALIRNRQTGIITLIHQSLWSSSAQLALHLQRPDHLDVLIMSGQAGYMHFDNIRIGHEKVPDEALYSPHNVKPPSYRTEQVDLSYPLGDYSYLKGFSEPEIADLQAKARRAPKAGATTLLGRIAVPGPSSRWSLTYRPRENVIMIYATGTSQLLFYPGFPDAKSLPKLSLTKNPLSAIVRMFWPGPSKEK